MVVCQTWILLKCGFFDIVKFVISHILIDSYLYKLIYEFTHGFIYSTFTQADEDSCIKYIDSQLLLSQGFASYIHAIASRALFAFQMQVVTILWPAVLSSCGHGVKCHRAPAREMQMLLTSPIPRALCMAKVCRDLQFACRSKPLSGV